MLFGLAYCPMIVLVLLSIAGDPLLTTLKQWIANDTSELPTGSDYLCTEVDFHSKGEGLTMVVTENYLVRKTKRVAMKETRHVPLDAVKKIALLEDRAHPHWHRRYMILIQYWTNSSGSKVYLRQQGDSEAFSQKQGFTLGTYTHHQAEQILNGLTRLCEKLGATLE